MIVKLELERMVHGGRALARLDDGQVALVAGGIPGEVVETDLRTVSGVLQGDVRQVIEASPDRVEAPHHPGLDYGFIGIERQLQLKRDVVHDALRRALGEDREVLPVRPAPEAWRYRSAVQPAVAPNGALGYRKGGSHAVVPLNSDPVANDAVDRAWRIWRETATDVEGIVELAFRGRDPLDRAPNEPGAEALVALVTERPERELLELAHALVDAGIGGVLHAPWDRRGRFRHGRERLAGQRTLRQPYGRFELTVTVGSFAQPNPAAASQLFLAAEALAPSSTHAVDLFAGGGALGMHLAAKADRVTCVEIDRGAIARGRSDTERLNLDTVGFERGDARKIALPDDADLVAVDPPRAGLAKELRASIAASKARHLLYVSCDPATWARDVADFERRGFRLTHAEPFDFFPHTHHIEMLSLLER